MSGDTWRQRVILRILSEHLDGLSTPQIAELVGEDMSQRTRALTHCGGTLRKLEKRGQVVRCGIARGAYKNTPSQVWRIKEAVPVLAQRHDLVPSAPAVTATAPIWQLVALLPPEGSEFPPWRRRLWLAAAAAVLDFVYAETEEDAILSPALRDAQDGTA